MRVLLFVLCPLCFLLTGFAETKETSHPLKAESYVETVRPKVGERFKYGVKIKAPKDLKFRLKEVGDQIEALRVVDYGKSEEFEGGMRLFNKWYILEGDLSGTYVLPAITVYYEDLSGTKDMRTSEIFVELVAEGGQAGGADKKGKAEESKDKGLRDIKGLIPPEVDYSYLWPLVIVLLVFGAITFFVLFKYRKNKAVQEKVVPPHEWAFKALNELKGGNLYGSPTEKTYHFQLSYVLRSYLTRAFDFNAIDMTTEEFMKKHQKLQIPVELISHIQKVLESTDLVKFTDTTTSEEKGEELVQLVEQLVEKTKPAETNEVDSQRIV